MSPRAIAIVGFMASGKTTLGRRLAEELDRPFVDLDQRIVDEIGMPIADYFDREGEEEFRRIEAKLLREHLEPGSVVATGGGVVEGAGNRELLAERAIVLWIDPPFELVQRRLVDAAVARPLVTRLGMDGLRQLYVERRALYAEVAAAHLETAGKVAPARIVREMVERLEELESGGREQSR